MSLGEKRMESPPKKRTRASHPKVRTGCHTCKARRVKCDEQRPSCQKCLSTGRNCEGYKNNKEWVIIVAPPAPVTDGFEDDRSRRHFDYFRSHAVYELSWFFEGGHWGDLVLKQTHSSAAVRHAVIALACSHEDFRDSLTVPTKAPQYAYAAQHYSKAIRNLIKETSDGAQVSRMRALICGLLFISIEILRGNNVAALHHLDGCLKIVREAQAKMGFNFVPSEMHPLERYRQDSEVHLSEEIIPTFSRLDIQASLILGRRVTRMTNNSLAPIVWDPSKHVQIQEPPLTAFTNVVASCNSLLSIANRIHIFMRENSDLFRYQLVRPIPMDVLTEKMSLGEQLMEWENAVRPLIHKYGLRLEHHHDLAKLTLMRIHNRTGLTLLESSLHAEECLLDNYQWAFEDIVNYTAELQERPCRADDESSTDSDSPGSITSGQRRMRSFYLLDNGVIFSLYWTALKARDGLVRRRAISLLEIPSQEGVWIGPIQAAIAKRIIEIEERQPYEQNPPAHRIKTAEDIPEYVRVHSVGTEINKMRRQARLTILQRPDGYDGEWHERIEWVYW